MWFDEIMDDCKQALVVANKHKNIFVPIFLKLALWIAIIAYVGVSVVSGVIRYRNLLDPGVIDYFPIREVLPSVIIFGLVLYLLILICFSIIDVGSINMFKAAISDAKPRFSHFTEGIKNYLLKVVLGKFLIHLVTLLFLPLLAVVYILYAALVGTLTGGWGLLFLGAFISVYLGTWVTIIVIEGYSPFKAIGKSFMLGARYFKGLFVILLASTLITTYSVSIFGPFAAIVGGWFFAGVAATYFKLIVMLIYYRNKERI